MFHLAGKSSLNFLWKRIYSAAIQEHAVHGTAYVWLCCSAWAPLILDPQDWAAILSVQSPTISGHFRLHGVKNLLIKNNYEILKNWRKKVFSNILWVISVLSHDYAQIHIFGPFSASTTKWAQCPSYIWDSAVPLELPLFAMPKTGPWFLSYFLPQTATNFDLMFAKTSLKHFLNSRLW